MTQFSMNPMDEDSGQLDETVKMSTIGEEDRSVPYLVVLAGDMTGKVIKLKRGESLMAGRVRQCALCFDCENVSRKHASFEVDDQGQATLTDQNSTNGTLVNGKKIRQVVLRDGDRICMGDVILRYSFQANSGMDLQEDLFNRATRDTLTGVFNKRYFMEMYQKEFAFHKRQKLPLSLVLLELDDLEDFTQSHGQATAEMILKSLSTELIAAMRKEDMVARFGMGEFAMLFRCTPRQVSLSIARKLIEMVTTLSFSVPNANFTTSASAGLATLDDPNFETPEEMLMAAEQNLYIGRNQGKNMAVG